MRIAANLWRLRKEKAKMNAGRTLSFAAVTLAVALASGVQVRGESVTAGAKSMIAVDLRADVCRAISPKLIRYSPAWCGVTNEGAYVVLEKVENAGTRHAVTTTVATFDSGEGEYDFMLGAADDPCVRFIHRVFSSDGVELAEPLVRDVAFGVKSSAGVPFVADSRTNSLQLAVEAGGTVNLDYSTAWQEGAASLAISAVHTVKKKGWTVATVSTNLLFSVGAEADGVLPLAARRFYGGEWELLCEFADADGKQTGETLTAQCSMPYVYGLTITVR